MPSRQLSTTMRIKPTPFLNHRKWDSAQCKCQVYRILANKRKRLQFKSLEILNPLKISFSDKGVAPEPLQFSKNDKIKYC